MSVICNITSVILFIFTIINTIKFLLSDCEDYMCILNNCAIMLAMGTIWLLLHNN